MEEPAIGGVEVLATDVEVLATMQGFCCAALHEGDKQQTHGQDELHGAGCWRTRMKELKS